MNSLLASSINGGFNSQQAASGSASVLMSSIDFSVTGVMTNSTSSQQGKSIIKLTGAEEILYNGQNKINCDQNKNSIENFVAVNGNKEKSSEDTIPIPKVQLYTGKVAVEWNQVYKIGAGLNNLGNTCFMNTVIQCLTYCPPLANYLLHDNDHSAKCTITGFCMMCLLQRHMKKSIGKSGEVIKPLDVYQRLKLIAKHFQFGRQEDAHEFLRYVIDHLWKSCLTQTNGVTKLDSASKETTIINKIFGGYHRSQVICLRCKKQSNTFDHFMDFILDIRQNVMSLEKALETFTKPELLQQENSYKCPKCKMKVEAQKRFSVYQAPTVATFQLKRFDHNRSFGGKITKQITYPEKLNLRPYMSDTQGDPVWYRLNAVLVHSGPSCNSGHYYCYVKNSNNYWYIMDDQRVHQVSLNQVLNQSAYVLFYIKVENTERTSMKKCLDNKNSFVKGTLSNSHFSKVTEVNNGKVIPLSGKISPFSSTKLHNSPNSVKKFNFSTPQREKISFGFRSNVNSTPPTSSKNKTVSPEPVSTVQNGLVPYMEDSSESSDASDSHLSENKTNSISDIDIKHQSKSGSVSSYKSLPQLEIKTKLSKSVFNTPTHGLINSTSHKVNATGSWIVTDFPQISTSSSSSATGVNSTTDWRVIEESDLSASDSSKVQESIQSRRESIVSQKATVSETVTSNFTENANETLTNDSSSSAKFSNGYDSNPSAQNCNFRKQILKSKTHFLEDEETNSSFKRKASDSLTKLSKDSYLERSESRYSPASKKLKHAESSFLNSESDVRNSGSNVRISDNSSAGSDVHQRQYSTSNCDRNSRTSLVNGASNPGDSLSMSLNKNCIKKNDSKEVNQHSPEKGSVFLKGKQDKSRSESSNSLLYEKEKLPSSNQGNKSSLYGTEVPTWKEKNHYRPSLSAGHEVRKSFDSYDNEFDRGKVRKSRSRDRHQFFHQGNPFQKHSDRYHGKFNGKFYNNHYNHRKFDSRHKWKSNYNDGRYHRYHNHHRHY